MNCSSPGFLAHCFLEFTQIHVCWVSDAIQPSHPLLLPSLFPRIRVFQMSRLLASSGQSIGASAKEFSTFLCMGRCKSLGSLKSFLSYASKLSGARILCVSHPESLRATHRDGLQPRGYWLLWHSCLLIWEEIFQFLEIKIPQTTWHGQKEKKQKKLKFRVLSHLRGFSQLLSRHRICLQSKNIGDEGFTPEIRWTEELGGLQFKGSPRVKYDSATEPVPNPSGPHYLFSSKRRSDIINTLCRWFAADQLGLEGKWILLS